MATATSDAMLQAARTLLDVARALAPLIREAAGETERARRLAPGVVEALRDAGLFAAVVPRDYGGLESDPVMAAQVVEEVAAADGSAGWCLMIAAQIGAYAGFMEPELARAIFEPRGILCGVGRPIGRAVPAVTPGEGFVISGRWPFASGSSHADWFCGECLVYPDGGDEALKDGEGSDVVQRFVVPRTQVTVHDTWNTTGLRGTASHDFSVEGVFVPASQFIEFGEPRHPWALYRSEPLFFINHGSHALGIARAAIEEATTVMKTKRGWGGVPLYQVGRMREAIARASVLVDAARTRVRLAGSHAGNASVEAVDLLHRALATSAIQVSSPLDRQFRDMHTAAAHVMIGPLTYEAAGRVLLGEAADFPLF